MSISTYNSHALIGRFNTERLALGWTYAETARQTGLDFNRVHRALVYARFSPLTAKAIADALGVDLRDYIIESDPAPNSGVHARANGAASNPQSKHTVTAAS